MSRVEKMALSVAAATLKNTKKRIRLLIKITGASALVAGGSFVAIASHVVSNHNAVYALLFLLLTASVLTFSGLAGLGALVITKEHAKKLFARQT